MSQLFFHSPSETSTIRGCELLRMGSYLTPLFVRTIDKIEDRKAFLSMIPKRMLPAYLNQRCIHNDNEFADLLDWAMRHTEYTLPSMFLKDPAPNQLGINLEVYDVVLNTVLARCTDIETLALLIFVTCVHHYFIEGPNRKWLSILPNSIVASKTIKKTSTAIAIAGTTLTTSNSGRRA